MSFAASLAWGDMEKDHQAGNCFLKGEFPILPWDNPTVDSAFNAALGVPRK